MNISLYNRIDKEQQSENLASTLKAVVCNKSTKLTIKTSMVWFSKQQTYRLKASCVIRQVLISIQY